MELSPRLAALVSHNAAMVGRCGISAERRAAFTSWVGIGHVLTHPQHVVSWLHHAACYPHVEVCIVARQSFRCIGAAIKAEKDTWWW